jgi:hypothetical protein
MQLDWRDLADLVAGILTCRDCTVEALDGTPQPPWVGADYHPGGIILLAQNPSSVRELSAQERRLLQQLATAGTPELLLQWSRWRMAHMESKPWTQWRDGFRRAVGRCLPPTQTAWLNLAPYTTAKNKAPGAKARERCRVDHLVPLLNLLEPRGVIARYEPAQAALDRTPGPWQTHPMPLRGIGVSWKDAAAVHRTLHKELGLARHPSCALAAA